MEVADFIMIGLVILGCVAISATVVILFINNGFVKKKEFEETERGVTSWVNRFLQLRFTLKKSRVIDDDVVTGAAWDLGSSASHNCTPAISLEEMRDKIEAMEKFTGVELKIIPSKEAEPARVEYEKVKVPGSIEHETQHPIENSYEKMSADYENVQYSSCRGCKEEIYLLKKQNQPFVDKDVLAQFLHEKAIIEPKGMWAVSDAYESYLCWYKESVSKTGLPSVRKFRLEMLKRFTKKRARKIYYVGVRRAKTNERQRDPDMGMSLPR